MRPTVIRHSDVSPVARGPGQGLGPVDRRLRCRYTLRKVRWNLRRSSMGGDQAERASRTRADADAWAFGEPRAPVGLHVDRTRAGPLSEQQLVAPFYR